MSRTWTKWEGTLAFIALVALAWAAVATTLCRVGPGSGTSVGESPWIQTLGDTAEVAARKIVHQIDGPAEPDNVIVHWLRSSGKVGEAEIDVVGNERLYEVKDQRELSLRAGPGGIREQLLDYIEASRRTEDPRIRGKSVALVASKKVRISEPLSDWLKRNQIKLFRLDSGRLRELTEGSVQGPETETELAPYDRDTWRASPSAPRAPPLAEQIYVTRTGSKYHRGGCGYLRRSRIPMNLKKARGQGYTACSRCW